MRGICLVRLAGSRVLFFLGGGLGLSETKLENRHSLLGWGGGGAFLLERCLLRSFLTRTQRTTPILTHPELSTGNCLQESRFRGWHGTKDGLFSCWGQAEVRIGERQYLTQVPKCGNLKPCPIKRIFFARWNSCRKSASLFALAE